mgnify:CR=1 FL=1
MGRTQQYRITEDHLDWLMTLNGDQMISVITRLTDRMSSILSTLHENGEIPKETQALFHIEEIGDMNANRTHLLGGVSTPSIGGRTEGYCSDECWCKTI